MPPLSGKQRRAQLKHRRALRRGEEQPHSTRTQPKASRTLQSQFIKLDKHFLDQTRALAGSLVLARPIQCGVTALRREWVATRLALPRRPKWSYQMSKDELDRNEQAYFRSWLAQQDAVVEQWQRASNTSLPLEMPCPPTHFERNIEVWRQFWRVTEISQVLLVLLDSRCPPLHLPSSLSAHLNIPTQSDPSSRSKNPRIILVLTKVDVPGPARTALWTSYLNEHYPGVPVVPVEAYAPKAAIDQGPTRYEPHLPGTFRERLVHTLRDVHGQLLQPPQWVTAPRDGETEEERLQRASRWTPRVKSVIDWDGLLKAKGKLVGKAIGGAAVPKVDNMDNETDDPSEWKEPEFLTVGVIGQPNVGKSSLLNAIFGSTRVRASRTPGKTKHFQTLFWTSDVRLVDSPGLVMPSFVPMDIQVLSGVLPISRISAVPFCVHQLAQLLPLEEILDLTHPSLSPGSAMFVSASTSDRGVTSKPAPPADVNLFQDKRTWRPGQRPLEQTKLQSRALTWTANDIMTAYADKNGWVTAKAGRPDIHRAGNAILRLVAEGKIPWGFWPPGSSVSCDDGIWLKDGVQQLDNDEDSELEELSLSSGGDETEVASSESDEDESSFGHGRFGVLQIDD